MIVKFIKLNELATTPKRGSDYAAGYDLYAATDYTIEIEPHTTVKIDTGIAIELDPHTFGAIYPRSGIATKRGLRLANCVGVIDADYRGPVIVPLHNDTDAVQYIEPKERIAQLIISPFFKVDFTEVDELSNTSRGGGGFGSTGTNN